MIKQKKDTTKAIIERHIRQSDKALSHHDLQVYLGDRCNRVTIYRILDRLIEEGAIHKVVDIDGVSKYASCESCEEHHHQHDHVHFSCVKCHEVTCLDDIKPTYQVPSNYKVEEANFTLSGICPACLS